MEKRRHAIPTSPQLPWKIHAYLSYFSCTPSAGSGERRWLLVKREPAAVFYQIHCSPAQINREKSWPHPYGHRQEEQSTKCQYSAGLATSQGFTTVVFSQLLPYFKSLGYNFLGFCCVENIAGVLWHLIHCKPYQEPVPGNPFYSQFAV